LIGEIVLIPEGMGLDAAKSSAQYIARGLVSIGMKVREHISVCPDSKQFQQAVAAALGRSNVLVVLGGMGPESSYMAKTVLSRGLGLPLEEHAEAIQGIREYCKRTGEHFDKELDSPLAMLPRGSAAFSGTHGKLPGCSISSSRQHIIILPEIPAEIPPMFNKYVSPYLGGAENATVTRTLRTYGLKEEAVRELLGELLNTANPSVTLQKDANEVLVRVASYAATQQQAAALCTPMLRTLAERLGDHAYGLDVDSLQSAVVSKLERRGLDLAVAEAGAGGNLTRALTETPGGQDILRYSVAVDDAESKTEKLGVNKKALKKEGNISEYAAVACASAAREKANTSFGVAVLANTSGEKSRGCPAGTVYIAVADAANVYVKKLVVGGGDAGPDVIADAALSRALNMLRLAADYHPEPYSAAISLEEALAGLRVTEQPENGEELDEPKKRKNEGFSIRKLIIIVASAVLVAAAAYVGYYFYTGYMARKQAAELQNMFLFGDMANVEPSPDFPRGYSFRFAGLWNVNPDVKAFITIPDTAVNYPVVQAADNDHYLRRDFYAENNRYGIPYLDYRADVKAPSDNLVVYGHNMRDGQLFGALVNYRELDYYREHPVIEFSTVFEDQVYKIFSVFITNAYENQGEVFNYHDFIDFDNDEQETAYLHELMTRSLINTGVDVQNGDKLLTLSTCTYEFEDARLVVVGRALRGGESAEVDTAAAQTNSSPLMPDVWYRLFGGEKPDQDMLMRIAQTSLVNLNEQAELEAASQAAEKARLDAESKAAEEKAKREAEEKAKKAEAERLEQELL
jgi:SrtB family sortase